MQRTGWRYRAIVLAVFTASLPLSAAAPQETAAGSGGAAAFLAEVRRRLPVDADLQAGYVCLQRETEVKFDGSGRPTSRTTREYEAYPSLAGSPSFKRLVARDGVAVPAAELSDGDRWKQAEFEARLLGLRRENQAERENRLRREAKERDDRHALVDEVFRLFDFRITGREVLSGRPAVLVAFSPRPGLDASNRTASIVQKFTGRAWIDEEDMQVIRIEARSTEDVNYGLGMFARIYKGTTVRWERRKVDGDAWVPARLEIRADARVLLFRRLGIHRITDYLDYRHARIAAGATAFKR
jgi:hypothetical protein